MYRHVAFVRSSTRLVEIRAAKIWSQLHGLDFPSFYLELAVIEALHGHRTGRPSANFMASLQWIADYLPSARLVDPANTNNIVSDDLTLAEKRLIAQQARVSLQRPLYGIIW